MQFILICVVLNKKLFGVFAFVLGLTCLFGVPSARAVAACSELPSDKGQSSQTINVSDTGQYKVWLRMLAPTAESNSVSMQVGDNCPLAVSTEQTGESFTWVQAKSGDGPATLNLTAGDHAVKVAGVKAGSGADKIMLLADSTCLPTGLGTNCQESKVTAPVIATEDPKDVQKTRSPNWWVISASTAVIVGTLAFVAARYITFIKRLVAAHNLNSQQLDIDQPSPLGLGTKLNHFWQHHKIIIICSSIVVIASLTVGITGATSSVPAIEVDTAQLTGGAKVADNANASGGRYVVFDNNPPVNTPTNNPTSSTTGGGGGTTQQGGGSTGGGGTGGSTGGGSTSCALPNYPTASCTGVPAGTTLSAVSGDQHITVAGTIIEGKNITGCVFIEAANVTIRKSKINCDWAFAIRTLPQDYTGGGLLIEDVEISCLDSTATGVASYGFTARRVNVHGCENAFSIDRDATVEDSYIHDLTYQAGSHTDGIQLGSDVSNVTISHNSILNQAPQGTSAIIGDTGTFNNVLITSNLMAGGAYTLYCPINGGTNYRVINNHFSRQFMANGGSYGPWVYCGGVAQVTGNIWHETGEAVAL